MPTLTDTSIAPMKTIENGAAEAMAAYEMLLAADLACDWLRTPEHNRDGNDLNNEARLLLRSHGWPDTGADAVAERIEEQLREHPVEVSVRSGWHNPGETLEVAEFLILLSTGGPAVRIIGSLDHNGEPYRARMESQDWFKPWTEYRQANPDTLLWFAGLFFYA